MNPEQPKPSINISRATRRPVDLNPDARYTVGYLPECASLPVLVQPTLDGTSLPGWVEQNRDLVAQHLRTTGAVLFRGFPVSTPPEFEASVKALSGELLDYTYRSTPRHKVEGRIYSSTDYPANRSIPMHNEMSYSNAWPMKLWFFSVIPASTGGETPIADSRRVLSLIPGDVRGQFEQRGVMYVRNYGPGIDLPWQDVFQTSNQTDVEQMCRSMGIEFEWRGDDELTTRQVCQGVATHPDTGDAVWFNQAHLFHVSSLDPVSRELLLAQFDEARLPRHAYYGDGGPIEESALEAIRRAYAAESVRFKWRASDVLVVDNMLVAHGRAPFEGNRRVLVGMAEQAGSRGTLVEM